MTFITFDGTNGKYHELMKSKKLHWSVKNDNITIK